MLRSKTSKSIIIVFFLGMQLLASANRGFCQDVSALIPQFDQLWQGYAGAQPVSVDWIYAPGKLDQIAAADFDCDGYRDELLGVTESNEIYYSLDRVDWLPLPGFLGQITVGDFDGDGCVDDLAGVTDSGDIYFSLVTFVDPDSLEISDWTNVPGKLGQVMAGDFNQDGKDELVGVTKSGQIYYFLGDLVQ